MLLCGKCWMCLCPREKAEQTQMRWCKSARHNLMLHIARRISNKHGGARQKTCQTLARVVAVGWILYGASVYKLSDRDFHDVEKLHRAPEVHKKRGAVQICATTYNKGCK